MACGLVPAIAAPLYVHALPEVRRGVTGPIVGFWHCEPVAAGLGSGASAVVSTKLGAVMTMSGCPSPLRSAIRLESGRFGQGPAAVLLFSAADPAQGGIACGEA